MGNITDALMASGQAPLQAAAGVLDMFGSPQQQAVPPMMSGGMDESGAIARDMAATEEAIVRGFKPKKRSLLGIIGDAILLHSNHKGPFFADRVREKNLSRAMESFTNDPLESIRRVAQIPGMADEAWKMYSQYRDDARGDQTQQRLLGKDRESIIGKANQLLGTIREDGSNYGLVRNMYNSIMARNNIDTQLPEEFDADYVTALYGSGMTPNQREMMEFRRDREVRQATEGDRRLDQGDRRLDITERNVDSQISSRGVRDQVAIRGVAVREQAEARQGSKSTASSGGTRKVKTKYGEGEVDPSGKYLRVTGPDGHTYVYRSTGPDKWALFKKMD